jgi:hypothetical protein
VVTLTVAGANPTADGGETVTATTLAAVDGSDLGHGRRGE